MSLVVCSWNVLADAYLRPEWYAHVATEHLDPAWRWPALCARLRELAADIFCLQEVVPDAFQAFQAALEPMGYRGFYAGKGKERPDGCAAFVRAVAFVGASGWHYADGDPPSGHVAQTVIVAHRGRPVAVTGTHLRWAPPEEQGADHVGWRQADELVRRGPPEGAEAWVVCGDLNAEADHPLVARLEEAGLQRAHPDRPATCNANGRARDLDHLLHRGPLIARPLPVRRLTNDEPLPSAGDPSDHLPIAAAYDWASPPPP